MDKTKAEIMEELLGLAKNMLYIINPKKQWKIEYLVFGPENRNRFTDWDMIRNLLRDGMEYVCIWDDEGYLLYTINVSADSVTWIMRELFTLIGDKF